MRLACSGQVQVETSPIKLFDGLVRDVTVVGTAAYPWAERTSLLADGHWRSVWHRAVVVRADTEAMQRGHRGQDRTSPAHGPNNPVVFLVRQRQVVIIVPGVVADS